MILCVIKEISTVRSWYVQLVGEEVCVTSLSGDQIKDLFLWHSVGICRAIKRVFSEWGKVGSCVEGM